MKQLPFYFRRGAAYFLDLCAIYLTVVTTLVFCVYAYGKLKLDGNPEAMQLLLKAPSTRAFTFWAHGIVFLSYFTLAQWYAGRTLGKWILGLQVVGGGANELSLGKAFLRTLGYILSGQLTLGVGFLVPLFRRDGRALHDLISGTHVVELKAKKAAHVLALPAPSEKAA
jgi:uncharacterized RDD family membrane protein YckC